MLAACDALDEIFSESTHTIAKYYLHCSKVARVVQQKQHFKQKMKLPTTTTTELLGEDPQEVHYMHANTDISEK